MKQPRLSTSEKGTEYSVGPEFVLALTEAQPRLFGFLLKRLVAADQAHEVLQETNLILCQKSNEFEPGTDFLAWAFSIARFQMMAFRKRQSRDRLVFPTDLIQSLERLDQGTEPTEVSDRRQEALSHCIKKLAVDQKQLVLRRYAEAASVKAIASETGNSANSVSLKLHRIRETLQRCIESQIKGAAE